MEDWNALLVGLALLPTILLAGLTAVNGYRLSRQVHRLALRTLDLEERLQDTSVWIAKKARSGGI
jgi:hypothetical protein